jgi:hypothetical protein
MGVLFKMKTWKSKNIYWHKIMWLDLSRIKKYNLCRQKYKVGQVVGWETIQKQWSTFDDEAKDITPYIIFRYIGKTPYSGSFEVRQKRLNELLKKDREKLKKQQK